ncbi:hypothetical protein L9F63_019987, partial [Diploptera punctata]
GPHEHEDDITIENCEKSPCKLKRKTEVMLEMKFELDKDVDDITNSVHAELLGLPFPFLGVDGTSACDQIYLPDGSKAGCPLKAGQKYVYRNNIKVLEIYPKMHVRSPATKKKK